MLGTQATLSAVSSAAGTSSRPALLGMRPALLGMRDGAVGARDADLPIVLDAVPDVVLPAALPVVTRDDLTSLAVAAVAHVVLLGAFVLPHTRVGAGGSEIEALGIEIVTVAPALQSRSNARGRGEAAADVEVRDADGDGGVRPPETAALDSRSEDKPLPDDSAPPPADLTVRDWIEPPKPLDAQASEVVIAPKAAEGRAPDAPTSLRPSLADQAMSVVNSIPAAELLAQLEGGAAARGYDKAAVDAAVMAAARAGRRDEYQLAVVRAIVENPPRGVRGHVGVVHVEFSVRRAGGLENLRILKSSGSEILDANVAAAIRAARLPVPPENAPDDALLFTLPFTFTDPRTTQ